MNGGFNECHEAIANAWDRLDVLLTRRAIAQRLPQHRNVVIEVVLLDGRLRPHRVEERLLGDQPPGILDQHAERLEHLDTERDHVGAARQPALARAGQRAEARQLLSRALALAKERFVCRFIVAATDVDLGDTEQAFESLEQAYLQRST